MALVARVCVKSNRETLCLSLISYTVEGLSLFKVFFTLLSANLVVTPRDIQAPLGYRHYVVGDFHYLLNLSLSAVWVAVDISYTVRL